MSKLEECFRAFGLSAEEAKIAANASLSESRNPANHAPGGAVNTPQSSVDWTKINAENERLRMTGRR